jgi:hypothetical protein
MIAYQVFDNDQRIFYPEIYDNLLLRLRPHDTGQRLARRRRGRRCNRRREGCAGEGRQDRPCCRQSHGSIRVADGPRRTAQLRALSPSVMLCRRA